MTLSTVILPSYASLMPLLSMSNSKKERKSFKMYLSLGTQVLSTLPAGTHPMFTKAASMDALYVKGQVRPSVKGKMREFHLKKVTCGYF